MERPVESPPPATTTARSSTSHAVPPSSTAVAAPAPAVPPTAATATAIPAPFAAAGSKEAGAGPAANRRDRTTYALHRTRWICRAVAFVSLAIAFFLSAGNLAKCNHQGFSCGLSAVMLIIYGIAALWSIAEFIVLCINRKGIHPGAHIAFDFIFFVIIIVSAPGQITYSAISYGDYYDDCNSSDPLNCPSSRSRYRDRTNVNLASGVFGTISALLYLALFVMACIAVHQWRMARRDARFVQMQAAYAQNRAPGQIPITGAMDPNLAYLVTYPDGRQVLVPPANQTAHPQSAYTGFYGGAPQHQHQSQYGVQHGLAPQSYGTPSTQSAAMTQNPTAPGGGQVGAPMNGTGGQQQQGRNGSFTAMPGVTQQPSNSSDLITATGHPSQQNNNNNYNNINGGNNNDITSSSRPHGNDHLGVHSGGDHVHSGGDRVRDSLYAPNSAVEAPEHGTTPRPGEAVPLRT